MRRIATLAGCLLGLVSLPAAAQLLPVGAPIVVRAADACSFYEPGLDVAARSDGSFQVTWADENEGDVAAKHVEADGTVGPRTSLLDIYGGLILLTFASAPSTGFETIVNALDNNDGSVVAFRLRLDHDGNLLGPATRIETPFLERAAPGASGTSLRLTVQGPLTGPVACQSWASLRAREVDASGTPIAPVQFVSSQAAPPRFTNHQELRPAGDGRFAVVWESCDPSRRLVGRRLLADGRVSGKPFPFSLQDPLSYGQYRTLALGTRGTDFAVAAITVHSGSSAGRLFAAGAAGNKLTPAQQITLPLAVAGVPSLAGGAGGYLLLVQGASGSPHRLILYGQRLDQKGKPTGGPVALNGTDTLAANAAVAALPGGRWVVVMRLQQGEGASCSEQIVARIYAAP